MKNQIKFLFALLSIAVLMHSCKDDEIPVIPIDDFAQEQNEEFGNGIARTCGTTQKMEELLSDPTYRKIHEEKFRKVEAVLENGELKANCSSPKIIPVAVHFQNTNNADIACLRQLAQTQIDILNADYGGTNSDINKWTNQAASYFPGISNGEACLKFCIADQNHPSGFGISNGDPAVTLNKTSGDNNSSWSGYLNIFVQPNTGVLGYSPLGGSGNGDGVVIDASAFGAGNGCGSISPNAPYNLGRTLTHEVGHYLLLDHIWGNGCSTDDDVTDTPDQASDYSGCPSISSTSCGSRDMHMNYMDYVNDACMYMFSAGQISRSEGYVATSLSNLTNNASSKCSGSTTGGGSTGGGTTGGGSTGGGTTDTCEKPSEASVQHINNTKVKLTWPAVSGATTYRIRYRKQGTTTWTNKSGIVPNKTLVELTANTTYQYQLRAKCPSGWTGFSSIYTFKTNGSSGGTTGGSSCNGQEVTVKVVLDNYGSETSWELVNANGNTVATGGPYNDNQAGAVKNKTVCLPNACYTLFLDDEFGDGICCDYGDGYLQVISNGSVIAESDGFFGYYDEIDFCVGPSGLSKVDQRRDVKAANKPAKL